MHGVALTGDEADGETAAEHMTLGRQVHTRLRDTILYGHLLPGSKLTLRGLAASLQTSIQPVREAVGRLAADGALVATPNRSIMVPNLRRAELDDLHRTRVLLEGEAAALFAERATEADLAELYRINEAMRESDRTSDAIRSVTCVQDWGLTISRLANSRELRAAIFTLRLRLGPHLSEALSAPVPYDPDFMQFTTHINHEVVLAFRDRDPIRARDLRRADILTFQRYLYQRLETTYGRIGAA